MFPIQLTRPPISSGDLPRRAQVTGPSDQSEVVAEGMEPLLSEEGGPGPDRLRGGLLGRARAGPAALGEHDEPGPPVTGARAALEVALLNELVDQRARRLPGHPEMF